MLHQFVQLVVLFAVEGETAIILFDELDGLAHLVLRESGLYIRKVEFADQPPCHCIAVQHRTPFGKGEAFEGVSHGVPQVQGFADAMFQRVLFYDVFLYLHGTSYHGLQQGIIYLLRIEGQQFRQMFRGTDEAVLQHLRIAGEEVMGIEAAQELGFQQHAGGRSKDADFILQTVEVDARLASHGSVDHGEQRSGNVDVGDAPLEGGSGKTAKVGHHATAQIDEQGVAAGPFLAQSLPYGSQRFHILVHIFCPDNNLFRFFQGGDTVQMRAAEAVGMLVGKDEKLVMGTLRYGMRQAVCQSFAKDYFLFTHLVNYKLRITNY